MAKVQSLINGFKEGKAQVGIDDLIRIAAKEQRLELHMDRQLQEVVTQLDEQSKINMLDMPKALQGKLREYQQRGLSWLSYLESMGLNPCLTDDMGLGKTMQIIALLVAKPCTMPALLVAPTSVVGNWVKEIEKFAPKLSCLLYHGGKRKKNSFEQLLKDVDIVITSFGLLRREKHVFQSQVWSRVIVDEAQNIKSPTAAQTKALCALESSSRIALTGTPVENRLMDLWSMWSKTEHHGFTRG